MSRSPDGLAPRQREAALRDLAALLKPGVTGAPPEPTAGWDAVCRLAAEHRLLPAVWSALTARGVRPLPRALRAGAGATSPLAVLEDAHRENALRTADLMAQGEDLLAALHDAGIAAMPIKGLHLLLAGWLPDPAARTMVDVDVLVHPAAIPGACQVAYGCGYRPLAVVSHEEGADHEVAPLILPGRSGSLELHRSTLMSRYADVLPAEDVWDHASTGHVNGRTQSLPSPTHAFALLIAHAQLQDESYRLLHLPLRALYDFALLRVHGHDDTVDWGDLRERFARVGRPRCLSGFLAAAEDLFGTSAPLEHRDGRTWGRATRWVIQHPAAGSAYREAASLPRALSAARMARLYDVHDPGPRTRARLRHVSRGGARRLASWAGRRAPELPPAATSRVLTVTPTESTLGAMVTGVDLGRLDERTWSHIEIAFHQFALLVFPGQSLSDDEQRNFGRRFGEVDQSVEPAVPDMVDAPTRIGPDGWIAIPSDPRTPARGDGSEWHADGSPPPSVPKASLVSALVVPQTGGETEFADLRAAPDAWSRDQKECLDRLVAPRVGGDRPAEPENLHRNPTEVSGSDETVRAPPRELATVGGHPPRILCHRWQVGDLVVWDNRCVVHRDRGWDPREARVMRHTRITDDVSGEVGVAGLRVSPSAT